jgi:hypothetical protein
VTDLPSPSLNLDETWPREQWISVENELLRVEAEIRLLDRVNVGAIVQIRDQALGDPRALAQLTRISYPRFEDPKRVERTLSAVRGEVERQDISVIRELLIERIDELHFQLEQALSLGTERLREMVGAAYRGLSERIAAEGLAADFRGLVTQVSDLGGEGPLYSLAELAAQRAGTHPTLRVVERPLLSRAAAGDGVLYIRKGLHVTKDECERILLHELEGHLALRERARHLGPPFRIGSKEAWMDEEGRAVVLEREAGLLSERRRRELGLGHAVALLVLEGAEPIEIFRAFDEPSTSREALVTAICRSLRGGGLCRELGYLVGFHRVSEALRDRPSLLEEMSHGRLSVRATIQLWRRGSNG